MADLGQYLWSREGSDRVNDRRAAGSRRKTPPTGAGPGVAAFRRGRRRRISAGVAGGDDVHAASTRITPLTICCQRSRRRHGHTVVARLAMITAPTRAPATEPIPPRIEVPPMKQEAMASNSCPAETEERAGGRQAVVVSLRGSAHQAHQTEGIFHQIGSTTPERRVIPRVGRPRRCGGRTPSCCRRW